MTGLNSLAQRIRSERCSWVEEQVEISKATAPPLCLRSCRGERLQCLNNGVVSIL